MSASPPSPSEAIHPHTRVNKISLALHRAVAERVREQPGLIDQGKERLRGWAAAGAVHRDYVSRWMALLGGPRPDLLRVLTEDGERERELRQNSPFAGVVSARERWAIIAEVDRQREEAE